MTHIMKLAATVAVILGMAAAGCGRSEQASQAPASTAASPPSAAQPVDITFKSDPDPVKMGDNSFEVMVMQGSAPVTDATVTAEFFMPAMPAMKMAEMRTKADLVPQGNGVYRGKGQVMMAGTWEVTVMAMRGGQGLGSKKLTVTAK